jgi:hypothetical protein
MSNVKSIGIKVSGLSPLETYNYQFSNKGGNWPVRVSPISGIFKPNSLDNVYEIRSYVEFCPTTGLCPATDPNVLYNAPPVDVNSGASVDRTALYSVVGLSVTSHTTSENVLENQTLVQCDNCLPNITLATEETILLNDSSLNTKQIATSVNGLIPNQIYNYEFSAIDSNWPIRISPRTGSIRSASDSATIRSLITVCNSADDCVNSLEYNPTQNCDIGQNPFAAIKLTITPEGGYQSPVSSDFTVVCEDCIPKLSLVLPSTIQLDRISKNKTSMNMVASNLKIGKQYVYKINSVDANWPAIVTPMSGKLTAHYDRMDIPVKVTLCSSTGLCPSNNQDVIDYSIDDTCLLNYSNLDRFVRFNADISADNCVESLDRVYSNDVLISCVDCLPKVKVYIPNTTLLSSDSTTNVTIFNADLTDLTPRQQYEYKFKSVDGNWPILISPISGTIVSDSTSASISSRLTFCRSTGLCDGVDNLLDYTYDTSSLYTEGLERYGSIVLEVNPTDCFDMSKSTSNTMLVRCDNCLPNPTLTHQTNSSTLSVPGVSRYQLSTSAQNLIVGETYRYNINYIDSNWPTIVSKQSGQFVAVAANKNITTELQFCFPSGTCSQNPIDVMPYRVSPITSNTNKYAIINLSITDITSNNTPVISDDFSLTCSNCLPDINYTIAFSGSPTLVLPSNCCSGNQVMRVNIGGAVPGDIHNYVLSSSTPNVSFMPSTGQIVFKQGGSGTIISMMSTALSDQTSAIAQCKLTNISSNIEAVDFLVIKCGSSAC